MTKKYRTIIIDDERLARQEVKRALKPFAQFEVVGEASNAEDAKALISSLNVDVMFLDIHMPEKSGLQLLEELTMVPEVVFTTAYDQYAVKAFELNALDYLVKPLRQERFNKTIEKVKNRLSEKDKDRTSVSIHQKVFVKDKENFHLIQIQDIWLLESVQNYARIHHGTNTVLIKKSLNLLEEVLPSQQFFRINRKQIVNIDYIDKIHPHFKNKLQLVFKTGDTFEVSSRQSAKFKNWISL
ncbi:response regulator transcription factor [uncultured Croceitalea sp.]|uniref:LytR/AlgR family response regulator transcription factor n=1 Tax=uncultured Croceitalea sp. TaxID=1798908 RepID=UPI003305E157